jgi:DNA-damage-inducible protein D
MRSGNHPKMTDEIARVFDHEGTAFEAIGQSNGSHFWYASAVMRLLGYESTQAFSQAMNRAIGTCTTLGIPVMDNFTQVRVVREGVEVDDHKLSRFACYLVAMNGDVRKPEVAAAQAYFATVAEAARQFMQAADDVARVEIRDEIADREKSLNSTASRAGVTDYGLFQNAGYRGMYNMNLRSLKAMKGLPDSKRTLLDFMDKRELAGNLFRITETEAKLQADQVRGQRPAEQVATQVGQQVRKMMIANTGTAPERMPLAGDINSVKKGLKKTEREFTKLDSERQPNKA